MAKNILKQTVYYLDRVNFRGPTSYEVQKKAFEVWTECIGRGQ